MLQCERDYDITMRWHYLFTLLLTLSCTFPTLPFNRVLPFKFHLVMICVLIILFCNSLLFQESFHSMFNKERHYEFENWNQKEHDGRNFAVFRLMSSLCTDSVKYVGNYISSYTSTICIIQKL